MLLFLKATNIYNKHGGQNNTTDFIGSKIEKMNLW